MAAARYTVRPLTPSVTLGEGDMSPACWKPRATRSGVRCSILLAIGVLLPVTAWCDDLIPTQVTEKTYQGPTADVARLERELERLKGDVATLKAELEQLRKVIESPNSTPDPAAPAKPPTEPPVAPNPNDVARPPARIRSRLVQRFEGHTESVRAVAVSPDGSLGASTGDDGTVRLWDLKRYRNHAVLFLPTSQGLQMTALAFSPDGKSLAIGGAGLFLIRLEAGRQVGEPVDLRGGWTDDLTFSHDGRTLASVGRGKIQFWDVESGKPVSSTSHEMDSVRALDLTRDGRVLCAGGYANNSATPVTYFVRLWDTESGQEDFRLNYPVRTVFRDALLLANDTRVLTAGPEGSVREWDVASGKEIRLWKEGGANCLAASKDRRYVAAGIGDSVVLFDALTGRVVDSETIPRPEFNIHAIGLSDDGRRVLFTGFHDRDLRSLRFEIPNEPPGAGTPEDAAAAAHDRRPAPVLRLPGHESFIYALCVSPDGKQLVSGGFDGTLRRWDLETGREAGPPVRVGIVNDLSYTPDGTHLLLARGQTRGTGSVAVWDVTQWQEAKLVQGHDHAVHAVAVDPQGKVVATGSLDTTIRLWDFATGEHMKTLTGHTNGVIDVAFSPDGKRLASAGRDAARLWDVDTGREIRKFAPGIDAFVFSPTKSELVSVGPGGDVTAWGLGTEARRRQLGTLKATARHIQISPDGRQLLIGAIGSVHLWDAETGHELLRVPATDHPNGSAIAFDPEHARLVSVDNDSVIEVWKVPVGSTATDEASSQ